MTARDADPSEWSSLALTRRLADYLVNAYTDGRGYDPTDLDDVEVTLRDGFDIVLGEMHEAQRDRSDGGGSEDSTTASECPATAEPPSAPVTASGGAEAEAARLRAVVDEADKVWRCLRCNGGGMVAPGDCCPTCAGDGLRVEWADDGSDLRPLVEAFAALAAEAQP